jgi:hypothetical protein
MEINSPHYTFLCDGNRFEIPDEYIAKESHPGPNPHLSKMTVTSKSSISLAFD